MVRTGVPKHICINKITCCHAVNELKSTVASPQTVIALTQLNKESIYET